MKRLLIANRGEIAIRIARSAAELGIETVAIHAEDDAASLHLKAADRVQPLRGAGPPAYLDIAQVVAAAQSSGCDALHPGYGFLSESAAFAQACEAAGLGFVGPTPAALVAFGDKARARALAAELKIPLLAGTAEPVSLAQAQAFLAGLPAGHGLMIKAVAGGGGRGMRAVPDAAALADAYALCRSEAQAAFGVADVYVEALMPRARHVEVQVLGDGTGAVVHLWERECSLQRQRQKIVEQAPAPALSGALRQRLLGCAVAMARAVRYRGAGTIEFLVDADAAATSDGRDAHFAFIEANARLQVEHTVTEAVTGLDLVALQLRIAAGTTLAELGLGDQDQVPPVRGGAVQLRVNLETMAADGSARPTGGILSAYEPPAGPGIRVDGFGYAGYRTGARYDSLIAKVIVHNAAGDTAALARKAQRALAEFRIGGVATNIPFLQALLAQVGLAGEHTHTRLIDERIGELLAAPAAAPRHYTASSVPAGAVAGPGSGAPAGASIGAARLAGTKVDAADPLAVIALGHRAGPGAAPSDGATALAAGSGTTAAALAPDPGHGATEAQGPDGTLPVTAPMLGTIVSIDCRLGDAIRRGQALIVMEAMKMQHVVAAPRGGRLRAIGVQVGDTVYEGHALLFVEPAAEETEEVEQAQAIDLDRIRPDLAEVEDRQRWLLDERRPEATAKRRKTGQRTVRENIEALVDAGSFHEYGGLAVAARRRLTPMPELIATTQGDSYITGLARINSEHFGDERARVVVGVYDYTVLAGTQGRKGHEKKDRLFVLAEKWRLPVVLFAEGGGGRGSDSDVNMVGGLHLDTFHRFARLSGLVPLVAVVSGYCFAGNAVLAGCCDVVIATENASIGMGGPAMIEGGGLGVYHPAEVAPLSVQVPNGVVDIAVKDETEAAAVARQYLSYFQGDLKTWDCADQRRLRHVVPENRLRAYDMRAVVELIADTGTMLELRRGFGLGMITALIRIEGRPFGVVANNPAHLAGAIDSPAADKAARFMQLCDAHDIPLLMLCDTPGNMVGPEHEKTALVRHCCRTYVVGANVTVPTFTIVIRKGYGLGALAMAGGSFHASVFTVAWPTGEFGGMGLEGQVKLGQRKVLAAIDDPAERRAKYDELVAQAYERGKALNTASLFELDNVIDPAATREWVIEGLRAMPKPAPREGKKRGWVDTW